MEIRELQKNEIEIAKKGNNEIHQNGYLMGTVLNREAKPKQEGNLFLLMFPLPSSFPFIEHISIETPGFFNTPNNKWASELRWVAECDSQSPTQLGSEGVSRCKKKGWKRCGERNMEKLFWWKCLAKFRMKNLFAWNRAAFFPLPLLFPSLHNHFKELFHLFLLILFCSFSCLWEY